MGGLRVMSFQINGPGRTLTLSSSSLLRVSTFVGKIMKLVDLRMYGDFVDHLAVSVEGLWINGKNMMKRMRRKVVAVFDTGLTGCLFTQDMWDEVQDALKVEIESIIVQIPSEDSIGDGGNEEG